MFYLRQRKDKMEENGYSVSTMNDELALSTTSVADFLKATPKAARFFLGQKTACVGCLLAKFCTLQDVVKTYQLEERTFREELAKIIVPIQR